MGRRRASAHARCPRRIDRSRYEKALAILLAAGLLGISAVVLMTAVDADECFGECIEVVGWGFDPFIVGFAVVNFLAWCLGLFLGRILRPIVRQEASENGRAA